jgi:adenylate kinase family enzyme
VTPSRIHITGGPGSGKTYAATRLAGMLGLPIYDLDGLLLAELEDLPELEDAELCVQRLRQQASSLAAADAWISDGAYLSWSQPFFDRAEIILWFDTPWRVASWRIALRHLKAELARKNRFPGWRRLYRFWRWSGRYYANRNREGLNEYGNPRNRDSLAAVLRKQRSGVVRCSTWRDVEAAILGVHRDRDG